MKTKILGQQHWPDGKKCAVCERPWPCGYFPEPSSAKEHVFKADLKEPMYCEICGASETDHRL